MTILLSLFLFLLLFPVASEAQTFCQNLGSTADERPLPHLDGTAA